MKYIIISVKDVKVIADNLVVNSETLNIHNRLQSETGSDIREIADDLIATPVCLPCVLEGQQRKCQSVTTWVRGRRLKRMIDRADGIRQDTLGLTNNEETSDQLKEYCASVLKRNMSRTEYKVICDETNNSPEDAENKAMNVDIIMPFVGYTDLLVQPDDIDEDMKMDTKELWPNGQV